MYSLSNCPPIHSLKDALGFFPTTMRKKLTRDMTLVIDVIGPSLVVSHYTDIGVTVMFKDGPLITIKGKEMGLTPSWCGVDEIQRAVRRINVLLRGFVKIEKEDYSWIVDTPTGRYAWDLRGIGIISIGPSMNPVGTFKVY